jgi:hypothetical protein
MQTRNKFGNKCLLPSPWHPPNCKCCLVHHWCHWWHLSNLPWKRWPQMHCLPVWRPSAQHQYSLPCAHCFHSICNVPHSLQCTDLNKRSYPSICCVVDTATTLCTGNYPFFPALAKQYPQYVAKLILPEVHSPIILSGIVQDNAHTITTNLPVAFQFCLPYLTKDGSATSFVVATGTQVSMNMVLVTN